MRTDALEISRLVALYLLGTMMCVKGKTWPLDHTCSIRDWCSTAVTQTAAHWIQQLYTLLYISQQGVNRFTLILTIYASGLNYVV